MVVSVSRVVADNIERVAVGGPPSEQGARADAVFLFFCDSHGVGA